MKSEIIVNFKLFFLEMEACACKRKFMFWAANYFGQDLQTYPRYLYTGEDSHIDRTVLTDIMILLFVCYDCPICKTEHPCLQGCMNLMTMRTRCHK